MGIHQQTWHDDFGAGPSGRGGSGASSPESGASGAGWGSAGRSGPSGFGRGWIPLERDIGIPGEDLPAAYPPGFSADYYPVAPAQAGAYPAYPHWGEGGFDAVSPDGPLPAQGRRAEEGDEGPDGDTYDNPYHFTPARRAAFLHHLAEHGNVRKACAAIGISTQAAYLARRRDRVFRSGWAAALVVARECVAQVLATRAIEGTREAIFYRGEVIGERVRYDTRLLLAHLARLDGRAEDALAEAHAERFDEILALVAGEDFPEEMADEPAISSETGRYEADPLLPMERWRHVERAGDAALAEARWGPGGTESSDDYEDEPEPEPGPLELAEIAAHGAAHEEWDDWDDRVAAVNDVLAAGALPEVRRKVWGEGDCGRGDRSEVAATSVSPTSPVAPALRQAQDELPANGRQVGAHSDCPQHADGGGRAEAAGAGAPQSPDAVTSPSPIGDAPAGELAPGGEGGWAPACAGATGESSGGEGAGAGADAGADAGEGVAPTQPAPQTAAAATGSVAPVEALARPASRAPTKRAARRAKARRRAREAGPAEPAAEAASAEFSPCTVPTVSTSPETRASAPCGEALGEVSPEVSPEVASEAADAAIVPPRRVPRVIFFDLDTPYGRR